MSDAKIEIVRVDADGAVVEVLHDDFPEGWGAARSEFGKVRHSDAGKEAAAAGHVLELRNNGEIKMTTAPRKDERKKRPSSKSAGGAKKATKTKPKPAAKPAEDAEMEDAADDAAGDDEPADDEPAADDAEPEEPKMRKMGAYLYYSQQNRPAAKQAVDEDPENAEMSAGDKNRAVVKKLGAMWKALEKADQEKWKEDAPMVEVKPKKPMEPVPYRVRPSPERLKKSEGGGAAADAEPLDEDAYRTAAVARDEPVSKRLRWPGGKTMIRFSVEAPPARPTQFCIGELVFRDASGAVVDALADTATASHPRSGEDFGPSKIIDGRLHHDFCDGSVR